MSHCVDRYVKILIKLFLIYVAVFNSIYTQAGSLEIEVGAFFSKTDTDIRVYDPFDKKEYDLNFESELNLPHDKKLPYFDIEYRFAEKHQVYLDWRRLHRIGVQESVNRPFEIKLGGNVYHVGVDAFLATTLDVDLARIGYGYRFYSGKKLDVHFLTGFHVTRLGLGFEGDIDLVVEKSEHDNTYSASIYEAITAPLPHFGFLIEHRVKPKLLLKSHAHAFYLQFDDITGWMYELEFGAKYAVTDNFNITGSFNYYEIGVDYDTELTDINITYQFYGPMLKMSYTF
ncbi:hypothetical protein ACPV5R_14870 [Vibrio astriarenae]